MAKGAEKMEFSLRSAWGQKGAEKRRIALYGLLRSSERGTFARAELSRAGQRRDLRPWPATMSRQTAIAIMLAPSIVPIPPQVQLCKSPPAAMARYLTDYDFKPEPPVRLYDEADGRLTGFIQQWWWQGRVGALVRARGDRACITAQLRRSQ